MDELLGRIFANDHSQIYIGYFLVLLFFLAARLRTRKRFLIPVALLVTFAWMVIENADLRQDWQYLFFAGLILVGISLGVRYYRRMQRMGE